MKINIHIERLVLQDVAVPGGEGPGLGAALETELTGLIKSGGLADGLRRGAAVPRLRGTDLRMPRKAPANLGKGIAHSLYGALGKPL